LANSDWGWSESRMRADHGASLINTDGDNRRRLASIGVFSVGLKLTVGVGPIVKRSPAPGTSAGAKRTVVSAVSLV
jgi:hypothetical protein